MRTPVDAFTETILSKNIAKPLAGALRPPRGNVAACRALYHAVMNCEAFSLPTHHPENGGATVGTAHALKTTHACFGANVRIGGLGAFAIQDQGGPSIWPRRLRHPPAQSLKKNLSIGNTPHLPPTMVKFRLPEALVCSPCTGGTPHCHSSALVTSSRKHRRAHLA